MKRAPLLLLLLLCACVVEAHPPPPRPMPAPEAVAIATQFARSHGLVIDHTQNAWLDRHARWHVQLGGAGGRDRATVTLDGFTGQILSAKLRAPRSEYVPQPPPAPAPAPQGPPVMAPQPNATPPGPAPLAPPPPPPPPAG